MTLEDLIAEVTGWHYSHFGTANIDLALAKKLVEEASEFRVSRTPEEAADVLIVLCAWAGRHNVDLLEAARIKLEIVKGRDQIARDKERGILPQDFQKEIDNG